MLVTPVKSEDTQSEQDLSHLSKQGLNCFVCGKIILGHEITHSNQGEKNLRVSVKQTHGDDSAASCRAASWRCRVLLALLEIRSCIYRLCFQIIHKAKICLKQNEHPVAELSLLSTSALCKFSVQILHSTFKVHCVLHSLLTSNHPLK